MTVRIDCHLNIFEDGALRSSGADVISALDRADIEFGVALTVHYERNRLDRCRRRNDYLATEVSRYPKRLKGIGSVHPDDGESVLQEARRCLTELGFIGIEVHPFGQNLDVEGNGFHALISVINEHGGILMVDTYNPTDPLLVGKLMRICMEKSKTKFYFSHAGGYDFLRFHLEVVLRRFAPWNPYATTRFNLSGMQNIFAGSPYADQLVWVVREIGVEKFFFGSDYPAISPADALAALRRLPFADSEIEAMSGQEPMDFFGFT